VIADDPPPAAQTILDFWFGGETEAEFGQRRALWFKADAAFDQLVGAACHVHHLEAAAGRLDGWAATPKGCLALLILLDQVPRNLFRGSPRAYATDAKALALAHDAVAHGFDRPLHPIQRCFVYLPLEHAETLADQRRSVALFEALAPELTSKTTLAAVHRHYEIIARFGRFPHRNAVLGRVSTEEELAFLTEPNSSF
jgi:uncharacterized protein (DUF924 family)